MSDSQVQVTEGSGKNVETKSIGGKERQVIVVGSPTTTSVTEVGDNGLEVDPKTLPPGASTETKQDDIIAILKKYSTNAIDDYTTASTTYICKEGASTADWYIMKIDETGNFPLFTYATVLNNPTKTTYALAYADRTTLTYGNYNLAF